MRKPVPSLPAPPLHPAPANDRAQAVSSRPPVQAMLYGLSAVTALPPDALLAPPNAAMPVIRAGSHPALRSIDLASVLDRPVVRVGHGNVALEQVDWRMRGLVASIDLSRTVDESAMLICLGVVESDRTASRAGRPTVEDLWDLVCEALPRHGVVSQPEAAIRHGALRVMHCEITAQAAWLSGDRLATVTVTSLRRETPIHEVARSVACVVERLLSDDCWRAGSASSAWPGMRARGLGPGH